MHSDRGRREGVVGREDQGSPVLTIMVGCVWWAGENVVPSARKSVDVPERDGGVGHTQGSLIQRGWKR